MRGELGDFLNSIVFLGVFHIIFPWNLFAQKNSFSSIIRAVSEKRHSLLIQPRNLQRKDTRRSWSISIHNVISLVSLWGSVLRSPSSELWEIYIMFFDRLSRRNEMSIRRSVFFLWQRICLSSQEAFFCLNTRICFCLHTWMPWVGNQVDIRRQVL